MLRSASKLPRSVASLHKTYKIAEISSVPTFKVRPAQLTAPKALLRTWLTQSWRTQQLVAVDNQRRSYGNPLPPSVDLSETLIDANTYEIVCNETLESLCEYFEDITETDPMLKEADVLYGDGVLTVKLGGGKGTYVINR